MSKHGTATSVRVGSLKQVIGGRDFFSTRLCPLKRFSSAANNLNLQNASRITSVVDYSLRTRNNSFEPSFYLKYDETRSTELTKAPKERIRMISQAGFDCIEINVLQYSHSLHPKRNYHCSSRNENVRQSESVRVDLAVIVSTFNRTKNMFIFERFNVVYGVIIRR